LITFLLAGKAKLKLFIIYESRLEVVNEPIFWLDKKLIVLFAILDDAAAFC